MAALLLFNFSATSLSDSLEKILLEKLFVNPSPVVVTPAEPRIAVLATAYSSTADQTDADPWIMANGEQVHDGVVAANFLPFGTKIKIPEFFGEKIFIVKDRMNKRYNAVVPLRIDVWFKDRKSARKFGVKETEIIIIKEELAENETISRPREEVL